MTTYRIPSRLPVRAAAVLAACLAGGCARLDQPLAGRLESPFFDEWQKKAETARGSSPAASARTVDIPDRAEILGAAPNPLVPPPETVKPLPTQKVEEFTLRDTDVAVALRSLAKIAGVNVLLSENVQGTVSIELRDVAWDQAFNGILKTSNLRYQWEGDILRVMTLKDLQDELEAQKVSQQRLQVAEEARQTEPLLMRTVNILYANAEDLRKVLEEVLVRRSVETLPADGSRPVSQAVARGSVLLDKGSNTLILHAIREDLAKMVELIEALDRPPRQVLIEAHIVEATSAVARELGVEWGGLYRSGNSWVTPGTHTQESILGLPLTGAEGTGIAPVTGPVASFPTKEAATGGLTLGGLYFKEGKRMLYAQLEAMQKESKLNILSSPSVTTVDNLEALIESGRQVPYETTTTEGEREVEWKDAVLRLKVTPHVIDGRLVRLTIDVAKDELDFDNVVTRTSAGATYPLVITKKATTSLILHDGETTVIGGLSKENRAASERGVPWLKDIPVLGNLFRSHSRSSDMDQLLIFITPHLLPPKPL